MDAAILISLGTVIAASVLSYLAASRRLSGKIGTSDAEQLWAESKSIREDYRKQIIAANKRIAELEQSVQNCETLYNKSQDENRSLTLRIEQLENKNGELAKLLETQATAALNTLKKNGEKDA